MTRQEIEKKMDELARKYVETHDPEAQTGWLSFSPPTVQSSIGVIHNAQNEMRNG
jgi:hypothetical protein